MAPIKHLTLMAAAIALVQVSALLAQAPPAGGAPPPAGGAPPAGANPSAPPKPVGEPKLVFDREVFDYGGVGRRDPFKPLVGKESSGPIFDDLKLKGVIYSSDPRLSLALVQDGAKRVYRLHRGEVVGNSRVLDIQPLMVKFAVETFGNVRNEFLELRPGQWQKEQSQLSPADQSMAIVNNARNAAEAKRMLDSLNALRAKQQQQPPKQEDRR